MTFAELKKNREITGQIDWDLTPQQAFEAYQIKSINSWKYRNLPPVYYFAVSAWEGRARVVLIRRSLKDSQEIAEIPVPADLVAACLGQGQGEPAPSGHHPIDQAIRDWLAAELET